MLSMTIQKKGNDRWKVLTIRPPTAENLSKTQGKNSKLKKKLKLKEKTQSRHFWDSRVPERCPNNKPALRGVRKKSGPDVKSSNFSANIGPTETYYIPNQWKLNKAFAELCRFEIAALIE